LGKLIYHKLKHLATKLLGRNTLAVI